MDKYVENIKGNLKNPLFIACLVGMALMVIGVFLPVYKVSFLGISQSVNYFSNDGKLADGIWIILLAIAMLGIHAFDKAKFACIPALLSLALLIHFYMDIKDTIGSSFGSFGIGFYVMIIGTIVAGVCSVLVSQKK